MNTQMKASPDQLPGVAGGHLHLGLAGLQGQGAAEDPAAEADGQQDQDAGDEAVGGDGEQPPAFLDPAQVGHGDEGDGQQGKEHVVAVQGRHGRGDGGDAGGHRHRHGEHVVDEQRGAGGLGRHLAQVLLGHDVGAAAAGVFHDRLPVAEGQQDQEDDDADADRHRQPEHGRGRHARGEARAAMAQGHGQGGHDLLGAVGHRGERVRREDRQANGIADLGVLGLVAGQIGDRGEDVENQPYDPMRNSFQDYDSRMPKMLESASPRSR